MIKKSVNIIMMAFFLLNLAGLSAQDLNDTSNPSGLIYKFDIKQEIAPPVWHNTKKSISGGKRTECRYHPDSYEYLRRDG